MISNEMFGSGIIRIKIKGYLKNNTDNELLEFEEKGIKIKNKIIYYNNNVKNTIKFSDKEIILIREGNDFLNTFVFNINKSYSNYLLKENNYDGIRQIHYNDFGRKRYEYAIINLDIINILNIPKESTDYMSLYSEAMLED